MTIHSISDYKKAKVIVKELEKALKIINATEASLRNYEKYIPIFHILTTIANEKMFLEVHLEQSKATIATKGKRYK